MGAVVMFSGGAGSWGAAKRTVERLGVESTTLLFADTLIEDDDLYRYLIEASANVFGVEVSRDLLAASKALPSLKEMDLRKQALAELRDGLSAWMPNLVLAADGRDPWDLFGDEKFMANTRVDICSRVLKRELMRKWLEANHTPSDTSVVLGFGWEEPERFERAQRYWGEWAVEAPMIDKPRLARGEIFAWLRSEGIEPPRLYELGFEHNNCGGFCVKAGQAQFAHLLSVLPDRYAYHERREQEFREDRGKDVAILRDRRGGTTKPLTLRALRERLLGDPTLFDAADWGGACSCMDNALEATHA